MKNFWKKLSCGVLSIKARAKRRKNKGNTNTVAIIKQDGIGDFVLFLPVAQELRKFYHDKKLIFCCGPLTESLAIDCGLFDQVIAFSSRDFERKNLAKTFAKFSQITCDLLLHPTQPRTVEAEQVAKWINAKTKIASLGEAGALPQKMKKRFDKTYDKLIDTGVTNMTLIQSANFVRGIGDDKFEAVLPKIRNVKQYPIALPDDFFVLFVGGSVFNKTWLPDRYCEVVRHVQHLTNWKCVVCGAEHDADQLHILDEKGTEYFSLVGKTSIQELIYVISKAKMVIGNDTCAIHIANAVDVPSVCVKGQFSGSKFFPYVTEKAINNEVLPVAVCTDVKCKWCTLRGSGYYCLHGDYFAPRKTKCIAKVTVEQVNNAVDCVLNKYYQIENNLQGE